MQGALSKVAAQEAVMGSGRWLAVAAAVGGLVLAALAYDAGLARGAAQAVADGSGALPVYAYGWGWHRPWGFGFAFPLFFLFFWLVVARGLFWGGPWRHRRWYYWEHDVPPSFEEWHRRAHERMPPEK